MRVRFVMEIEVFDDPVVPTAENLQEKMRRFLTEHSALSGVEPTWRRNPNILRTILIQDDGSKTAV